ncbi:cysteine protease atg4, putative [Entamoeba invadens IP1]|uniref:cysteine protease atg4, putative n=1 Tax=Entamoeba invadens IP1 TaxID=370355 RepID=UPI0002C3D6E9|nr:cysteine protease atg4, putative [Entamoeba invadens IP1]ELP90383.1 cysteine protease atg4, putative [Entamoeba invadens IP1]|eukprot:XP_004257154.1 cysteine protease atg4, putative [Entamoeba invadens IP1]
MEVGTLTMVELGGIETDTDAQHPRELREDINLYSRHTIWVTYRKNMKELPGGRTSDSGWGCMIRSMQMALAQSFVSLVMGNSWKFTKTGFQVERNKFHLRCIINLFGDGPGSLFSIHNLISRSTTRGVGDGKWWGPSFASEIAADHLNTIHVFRTRGYVARLGRIVKPDILDISEDNGNILPTIIFVPLRLGPVNAEEDFRPILKKVFDIPQCVGMVGGKPNLAFFFHTFDGNLLYYLDPHTTQNAVSMDGGWSAESYFCNDVKSMKYKNLDPSVSLLFLIKNKDDFNKFEDNFKTDTFSKLFVFKNEREEKGMDEIMAIEDDDVVMLDI